MGTFFDTFLGGILIGCFREGKNVNQVWKELGMAGIMGLAVPGILLGVAVAALESAPVEERTEIVLTEASETPEPERIVSVLMGDGSVAEMELNEYLTGVILAEMPATFEEEARKAQAVVARTYTVRACERDGKHENAAVCTDATCCQGYISPEEYLENGGKQDGIEKMRSAAADTDGLVLTYNGELIEATYFSCSGGSTEDALAVWGTDVPYLQAVDSPGEEEAKYYTDTVTFTAEEFRKAVGLSLPGDPESWFGTVTYTEGGGVDSIRIGDSVIKGTELRKLLGLRSTAFTISVVDDVISITTRGYGHRVGMSQYGADAMAASGSRYEEILAHYYQGALLSYWVD